MRGFTMLYRLSLAVFAAMMLTLPTAAFAAAARVKFIVGKAVALDVQGRERLLARGANVSDAGGKSLPGPVAGAVAFAQNH
jgi:hypothetical protein